MKVCANGARDISEHQALCNNPVAVAAECAKALKAGAGGVHVYPKNQQGEESLSTTDVDRWGALCVSAAQIPR